MALFLLFWGYRLTPTPSFFSASLVINPELTLLILPPKELHNDSRSYCGSNPVAHIKRTVGDI